MTELPGRLKIWSIMTDIMCCFLIFNVSIRYILSSSSSLSLTSRSVLTHLLPVRQTHPASCPVPRLHAVLMPPLQRGPAFTLKDLHGQDGPGVLQVGDVQVACCVAGQADVEHPEGRRPCGGQTSRITITFPMLNELKHAHAHAHANTSQTQFIQMRCTRTRYLNISRNRRLKLSASKPMNLRQTAADQRSSRFASLAQTIESAVYS